MFRGRRVNLCGKEWAKQSVVNWALVEYWNRIWLWCVNIVVAWKATCWPDILVYPFPSISGIGRLVRLKIPLVTVSASITSIVNWQVYNGVIPLSTEDWWSTWSPSTYYSIHSSYWRSPSLKLIENMQGQEWFHLACIGTSMFEKTVHSVLLLHHFTCISASPERPEVALE